ncbi:GIY-YIG nuclease family protein [Candidatus Beckwithbacteria bacterium]|nr:GIY-YIG nuclease family protein [Candidatus Beckwithbacteria bacterium]
MVIKQILANKIKKAPKKPGVYIFRDSQKQVLYVGKAIILKNRLKYYTLPKSKLFPKTALFLTKAASVNWIVVRSEIEAILLEMNLIRTLKPKYNARNRDDKRPLYILFTNDELPRVLTARIELPNTGEYIGPFPSAYKLKEIMRTMRRIFPYCSCKTTRKKACLYVDLGLCPNPLSFTSKEQVKNYKRNLVRLKWFLHGRINYVLKLLNKDMQKYSQNLQYEQAGQIKNQIDAITQLLRDNHQISQYLTNDNLATDLKKSQLRALIQLLQLPKLVRIEGYDIANLQGSHATASMVVFTKGLPNTSQYRKFKIRNIPGANDPKMIYQTLKRRLGHKEWPLPDLILVDGGKSQVQAGLKALQESGQAIPLLGLAKKWEQLVIKNQTGYKIITLPLDNPALTLLRAIRDEAHRFTTTYHKKLRKKSILKE